MVILAMVKDKDKGDKMEFVKIPLETMLSKKLVERYGGVANVKDLLYDIIERYGNEDYFDESLLEK